MSEIKQWWIHCSGKEVLDFEAADTDYLRNPLNGYTLVMTRHDHDRLMKQIEQRLAEAEKALEFYADSKSWKFVDYKSEVRETIISTDLALEGMQFPFGGKRAREYFEKWGKK